MHPVQPFRFELPADFPQRAANVRMQVERGDAMTFENLAEALGLPFEFVSASVAIAAVLQSGRPVLVDPAPAPPSH